MNAPLISKLSDEDEAKAVADRLGKQVLERMERYKDSLHDAWQKNGAMGPHAFMLGELTAKLECLTDEQSHTRTFVEGIASQVNESVKGIYQVTGECRNEQNAKIGSNRPSPRP